MNKTEYKYLKDLCSVNQGLQIPISERYNEGGNNRYFYITVQFLKDGHKEKYYVENPPNSSICDVDDIIVVRTGSTGQVLTGVKGCFHNNFFKVNFDKDKILGKYLYYCLKSPEKQREMHKRAGITTIPDLNHFMFLDMKIPYFNLNKQKDIVQILDALNNKIELNNKINAELEAMAKTLYDYWFVQFDFPDANGKPYKSSGGKIVWNEALKREIPEGWEVKKISEIIEVKDGTHDSPKSKNTGYPLITSKNLKVEGLDFENANLISEEDYLLVNKRSKVETGDILFSMIGNIGTIYKIEEKKINFAIKNVALYKTSQTENYKNFIYMFLKSIDMDRYMKNVISGSIQKFIGLNSLRNAPIFINTELIMKYNEITHPIFIKLENSKLENQELASLRDWLLPMLMNGQVSVCDTKPE
jgi:type I restriction enzyme S subunit